MNLPHPFMRPVPARDSLALDVIAGTWFALVCLAIWGLTV
jgi:hypothetical protein